MFKKSLIAFMAFVFVAFFSNHAFAQADATGFEIKVAATAPILLSDTIQNDMDTFYGVGLNLVVGYRWQYFGVYVDQDFNAIFLKSGQDKYEGHFMGAFHAMGRAIFPVDPSFLIYGGFGVGFIYGSSDSRKLLMLKENEVNLSLKAQVGFSYFLNDRLSLGLDFSYTYVFLKTAEVLGVSVITRSQFHMLTPNFHVDFNF